MSGISFNQEMLSLLCNGILWLPIVGDHCSSLNSRCESRRHHWRVHSHLWLNLHYWISRVNTCVSGHRLLLIGVLHFVTDILLFDIIKSTDLFNTITITAMIVITDINSSFFFVNLNNFNLRCTLTAEEAAADTPARPSSTFHDNNHENCEKDYHSYDYERDDYRSRVHCTISVAIVSTYID